MVNKGDFVFIRFFRDLPHYTYICYGTDDNGYAYYVCLDYQYCENIQQLKGVGIPYKLRTQHKRSVIEDGDVEVIDDEDMNKMDELDPLMEHIKCDCCLGEIKKMEKKEE